MSRMRDKGFQESERLAGSSPGPRYGVFFCQKTEGGLPGALWNWTFECVMQTCVGMGGQDLLAMLRQELD
jgi:hypothetical protein